MVKFWAGDLMKYWCSCCSNPTMRKRSKEFRWKWMAELYRWYIGTGPTVGMQVLGPIDAVESITLEK